jgi:hypothetical protein
VGFLIAILTLVLIALVVTFVGRPLRQAREDRRRVFEGGERPGGYRDERQELEAAREAKYREIRDAEMDYRTGKLSRADYEAIDANLRADAIEILDRLERLTTPRDA